MLLAFGALVWVPGAASAGAVRGLAVCGEVIVPSLLPFLVFSGLLTRMGLPGLLARAVRRLPGVPGAAAAPFLLGLTGGYPVGAASVAELTKRGELTRAQGARLLPVCNNTGPAFILGAAGAGVFGSARAGALLYAAHILAAAALALLLLPGLGRDRGESPSPAPPQPLAAALPESVKAAVGGVLGVCGFVVFFSVVTALLDALGLFSGLAGLLAAATGAGLHRTRALLTGVLELGSGIAALRGLDPTPGNLALASFLLGFGGLSVHCQTLAAAAEADLPIGLHFLGRVLHGLVAAGLTFLLAGVIK